MTAREFLKGNEWAHGTIISGTLRTYDLIVAFIEHIEAFLDGEKAEEMRKCVPDMAWYDDDHPFWESEEAVDILDDLFDVMNGYAPEGYYFGAHPGDGSDFGFWPIEEEE